jgi:hypothetical protein
LPPSVSSRGVGFASVTGEFDRLFRIETRDKRFARTLFHPGMRALLLGADGEATWLRRKGANVSFELERDWAGCDTQLLDPKRIQECLIEPLTRFRSQIPQSAFEGHRESG